MIDLVVRCTKIPREQLLGPRGRKYIAESRHLTMWLLAHTFPNASYNQIGRVMGRDHSTVFYGINAVDGRMVRNDQLRWLGIRLREVAAAIASGEAIGEAVDERIDGLGEQLRAEMGLTRLGQVKSRHQPGPPGPPTPTPVQYNWCEQCQRRVSENEICTKRFCSLRPRIEAAA